jgi:hypothetical protein
METATALSANYDKYVNWYSYTNANLKNKTKKLSILCAGTHISIYIIFPLKNKLI